MQLTKYDHLALDLSEDVVNFICDHHGEAAVTFDLSNLLDPFVQENFDLTKEEYANIYNMLGAAIVSFLRAMNIEVVLKFPKASAFVLGGYILPVVTNVKLRIYEDG